MSDGQEFRGRAIGRFHDQSIASALEKTVRLVSSNLPPKSVDSVVKSTILEFGMIDV